MGLIATITGDDLELVPEVTGYGTIAVDSDDSGENDVGWNDEEISVTVPVDYTDAFAAFAQAFYGYATDLVPVDTGYLQSTITSSSDDWSMTAEASAEYAQYVEYGTWKMSQQPYFRPALEYAWEETATLFEDAVQQAADQVEERLAEMGADEGEADYGGFSFGGLLGMIFAAVALIPVMLVGAILKDALGGSYSSGGRSGGGANFDDFIEIY